MQQFGVEFELDVLLSKPIPELGMLSGPVEFGVAWTEDDVIELAKVGADKILPDGIGKPTAPSQPRTLQIRHRHTRPCPFELEFAATVSPQL